MYPTLFQVEKWITDTIRTTRAIMYEYPYIQTAENRGNVTKTAHSLARTVNNYRNRKLLDALDIELRDAQFDRDRASELEKYVSKVIATFEHLWTVGFEFEEFYCALPHEAKETDLGWDLNCIRSFFKCETWDKDPYNFEPTILSVLAKYLESESSTDRPEPPGPGGKLQWNGANDTLYDVFRQLKNHHLPNGSALIEGSYDQIAAFIKQSFVGFDNVATSTIRGKLTKSDRPKKSFNRVDLDFTETD